MEFIKEEDMEKFTQLGFTFSGEYTANQIGSTYHCIVKDKDGNEVVHTTCSYGNASGHGYAVMGARTSAVEKLNAYIENPNPIQDEIDTDFLYNLVNWGYISDYGYDTDGDLILLFDSWEQLEGREDRNTDEVYPSVFAKLVKLGEKGLLKPSIKRTLDKAETGFTDSMRRCDGCGKIINIEWEGLHWIDSLGQELCNDCLNETDEAIEELIEQAKDDFSKAVPVMISEDKIEELGYEKLDTDKDFSSRYTWGEEDWSCHNVHAEVCDKWCKEFDGFAKLVWVGQFDAQFQLYFPSDRVEEARLFSGIGNKETC